jgi:hypothetical protein
MKKLKLKSKIVASVLVGSMLMTSGLTVMAEEMSGPQGGSGMGMQQQQQQQQMTFTEELGNQLVTDGIITQDQLDSLLELIPDAPTESTETTTDTTTDTTMPMQQEQVDIFEEAVEEGILTDDEVTAIEEEMLTIELTERFTSFVDDGTITDTELASIIAYGISDYETTEAEQDAIDLLTDEEKQAYFEENQSTMEEQTDLLDELVTAGILTQDQVDIIAAAEAAAVEATTTEVTE